MVYLIMATERLNASDVDAIFFEPETGNEINNIALVIPRRKETVKDWLMIFHQGTMAMALDPEIRGETYRVFMYAISHVDYENKILVTQRDVAEGLNIKQPHVSRAFRQLVEKGILVEDKKYGTMKTYKLNTEYGWKGSVKNLKKQAVEETKQKDAA
jgi:predicted transcriptional regulator